MAVLVNGAGELRSGEEVGVQRAPTPPRVMPAPKSHFGQGGISTAQTQSPGLSWETVSGTTVGGADGLPGP